MFTLKNAPTDPLFLNESGSALSRANYLFISNKFYILGFDLTWFGLVFPRALILVKVGQGVWKPVFAGLQITAEPSRF